MMVNLYQRTGALQRVLRGVPKMPGMTPDAGVGYRWYTFGRGPGWLKLGPVTFAWFHLSDGRLCVELHWQNRLLIAKPDWRKPDVCL
jgi:hypothetical protein